jgi:hypothetical protein
MVRPDAISGRPSATIAASVGADVDAHAVHEHSPATNHVKAFLIRRPLLTTLTT